MKGLIGLDNLEIHCIIGVHPHERSEKQPIFVDLQVETDFSKCSASDDIIHTVNYEALARICRDLAGFKRYNLLETFANDVLEMFIKQFDVSWGWIRIKKPNGISNSSYSIVELEKYSHEK